MAHNEMAGQKMAVLTLNALKRSLFLFAIVLTACAKDGDTIYMADPNEEAASTAPLVTVIYGPGDLGDRRYCDLIYEGAEKAAATHGLRTMQMSPQSFDEGLQYLELMFSQMAASTDTVRRLFIVPQPAYYSFIRANSHRLEANPYADLLYLETQAPLEGKGSTLYLPYYGAMYEAGALTPLYKTKVVLIGANPYTETVAEAMQGFADGFATGHIVPDPSLDEKKLRTVYLSEQAGGGFSIADTTAMRLMDKWKTDEMELLVPVCGGACNTFNRLNPTGTATSACGCATASPTTCSRRLPPILPAPTATSTSTAPSIRSAHTSTSSTPPTSATSIPLAPASSS